VLKVIGEAAPDFTKNRVLQRPEAQFTPNRRDLKKHPFLLGQAR
jgi:hypothetical protein